MRTLARLACLVLPAAAAACAGIESSPPPRARAFVEEYAVGLGAPGLPTVRSLVRALCSRQLFTPVERRTMAEWHRDPAARESWLARMGEQAAIVARLGGLATQRLLDADEDLALRQARRRLAEMRRQDAAWREVYHGVAPGDYPFVLDAEAALRLQVLDGCTSRSRTFALLARTTGFEVRLVTASDLEGLRRIWRAGQEPVREVVNGHKMVLLRIAGRWHLVDPTHYVPEEEPSFVVLTELGGAPISPEALAGTVLRLPSMQVADGRRCPALLITHVGDVGSVDLGERSLTGEINLAVSGDPGDPICRNPQVAAALAVPAEDGSPARGARDG